MVNEDWSLLEPLLRWVRPCPPMVTRYRSRLKGGEPRSTVALEVFLPGGHHGINPKSCSLLYLHLNLLRYVSNHHEENHMLNGTRLIIRPKPTTTASQTTRSLTSEGSGSDQVCFHTWSSRRLGSIRFANEGTFWATHLPPRLCVGAALRSSEHRDTSRPMKCKLTWRGIRLLWFQHCSDVFGRPKLCSNGFKVGREWARPVVLESPVLKSVSCFWSIHICNRTAGRFTSSKPRPRFLGRPEFAV